MTASWGMWLLGIAGCLVLWDPAWAQTNPHEGLYFQHHDWELACDNSGTCRAAGYQPESDEKAVSLLLVRRAGAREAISGRLMLGEWTDTEPRPKEARLQAVLRINGQQAGVLNLHHQNRTADLTPEQVASLLAVLSRSARMELTLSGRTWRLSDRGATAVLLKMDEFQGRIGTVGALVRPGPKSEDAVPAPRPLPVVQRAPLPKPQPGDTQFLARHGKVLRQALRQTVPADDCPDLAEPPGEATALSAVRLSAGQMLVYGRCWLAAYNAGSGFWVVKDHAPFDPVLVTSSATDWLNNTIVSEQKGRGLGDCMAYDEWVWNGSRFVHTRSATTGLCRLVNSGGAWDLPTRLADVR